MLEWEPGHPKYDPIWDSIDLEIIRKLMDDDRKMPESLAEEYAYDLNRKWKKACKKMYRGRMTSDGFPTYSSAVSVKDGNIKARLSQLGMDKQDAFVDFSGAESLRWVVYSIMSYVLSNDQSDGLCKVYVAKMIEDIMNGIEDAHMLDDPVDEQGDEPVESESRIDADMVRDAFTCIVTAINNKAAGLRAANKKDSAYAMVEISSWVDELVEHVTSMMKRGETVTDYDMLAFIKSLFDRKWEGRSESYCDEDGVTHEVPVSPAFMGCPQIALVPNLHDYILLGMSSAFNFNFVMDLALLPNGTVIVPTGKFSMVKSAMDYHDDFWADGATSDNILSVMFKADDKWTITQTGDETLLAWYMLNEDNELRDEYIRPVGGVDYYKDISQPLIRKADGAEEFRAIAAGLVDGAFKFDTISYSKQIANEMNDFINNNSCRMTYKGVNVLRQCDQGDF